MAWQDSLRKASFKGVPFYVDSTDGTFGRRVVVHEFPLKKDAYAEDMGKKASEFTVDAFVIGENYFDARDALLDACNEAGPGDLIHPFLGKFFVVCTGVTLRENIADGGIARFSLKFTETSDPTAPTFEIDAISGLLGSASKLVSAAKSAFETAWSVVGFATYVADKAVGATEAVLDTVEGVQRKVRSALNEVADLGFKIRKFRANIRAIVAAPDNLATQIDDTFIALAKALGFSSGGEKEAAKLLKTLFTSVPAIAIQAASPAETPNDKAIKSNAQALDNYVKQLAVAYQATALAQREFDSAQEAAHERADTLDAIDAAMETASDEVFVALQALRVAVARAVPAPGQTLAQEIDVPVVRTEPSLVLVYELFDSIDMEADLIARNAIRHPGFVAAGENLKALNG